MDFVSKGTLCYSPKLWKPKDSKNWWLLVKCDPEIGSYFRHLYYLSSFRCCKLLRPTWAEHITVIRNEEPSKELQHLWEKYSGDTVEFLVSPVLQTNGTFCWLNVKCEALLDLRVELGLAREPEYPLHLTVGNCRELT